MESEMEISSLGLGPPVAAPTTSTSQLFRVGNKELEAFFRIIT